MLSLGLDLDYNNESFKKFLLFILKSLKKKIICKIKEYSNYIYSSLSPTYFAKVYNKGIKKNVVNKIIVKVVAYIIPFPSEVTSKHKAKAIQPNKYF